MKSTKINMNMVEELSSQYTTEDGTFTIGNASWCNGYGDGDFSFCLGNIENDDHLVGTISNIEIKLNVITDIWLTNGHALSFSGNLTLKGKWAVCNSDNGNIKLSCLHGNWKDNIKLDGTFTSHSSESKQALM